MHRHSQARGGRGRQRTNQQQRHRRPMQRPMRHGGQPRHPHSSVPQRPQGQATGPAQEVSGTLELTDRADGHLRDRTKNYAILPDDANVPAELVRKFGLRGGEHVDGIANQHAHGGGCTLSSITQIDELPADQRGNITPFDDLTVIDPRHTIRFETTGGPLTMRVVDLITPIGRGQRGLIVAPPRTGKTILLTQMATAISANNPDARLMMLLIDERPEEVTEMKRSIGASGAPGAPEVVYSSNDKDTASHVRLARLMIARARRQVELGRHVIILLDSLTRLGRAFNAYVGSSGRTMTGGIDIKALTEPKAMFGAARNIENGGSLTIIASCLIETGSRMDDFIFQEFKGTGNMELVLSRELANFRIWPAIDIEQSGTRKEELLLPKEWLPKTYQLRRRLLAMRPLQAMQTLTEEMAKFKNNADFVAALR